jgi:hypothetical protein
VLSELGVYMSGNSTGQVLGATTTTAGIAVLPSTGDSPLLRIVTIAVITIGVMVALSFAASRLYRKVSR